MFCFMSREDPSRCTACRPCIFSSSVYVCYVRLHAEPKTAMFPVRRLSFNEELAKPLTVLRNPYHLAAIKGNIALAAFLHERGVSLSAAPRHFAAVGPTRSRTADANATSSDQHAGRVCCTDLPTPALYLRHPCEPDLILPKWTKLQPLRCII